MRMRTPTHPTHKNCGNLYKEILIDAKLKNEEIKKQVTERSP
jgi:hypothetical protein